MRLREASGVFGAFANRQPAALEGLGLAMSMPLLRIASALLNQQKMASLEGCAAHRARIEGRVCASCRRTCCRYRSRQDQARARPCQGRCPRAGGQPWLKAKGCFKPYAASAIGQVLGLLCGPLLAGKRFLPALEGKAEGPAGLGAGSLGHTRAGARYTWEHAVKV